VDTIFALATAAGRAGVAVIRISGPEAHQAAGALAGPLPVQGRTLRSLRDGTGEVIDQAMILTFAEGRSFTGEAVAELHLHGSPAVIATALRLLGGMAGLRPAAAGEFTRRAFENGRLDLAQVEGLADLIDAETELQRKQAMRVFSGALGRQAAAWRAALLRAAALIAASIDFADEDIPADLAPELRDLLQTVIRDLVVESDGVGVAERIREGFEVAIMGAPNVGKSTLLNALAGREAAITSEFAGTTRDVIEVRLDIDGLPVTLLDTAGLRDSADLVESIGIGRARSRGAGADLRIWMVEGALPPDSQVLPDDIVVLAKGDLHGQDAFPESRLPETAMSVSGLTGAGIDALVGAISAHLRRRTATVGIATRERHRLAMRRAITHLDRAVASLLRLGEQPEIVADEVDQAMRAIDAIVGRIDVEQILGEVFARFCIGK
jgi:tRNA modification GTPase